jgi:hypothetical protein
MIGLQIENQGSVNDQGLASNENKVWFDRAPIFNSSILAIKYQI